MSFHGINRIDHSKGQTVICLDKIQFYFESKYNIIGPLDCKNFEGDSHGNVQLGGLSRLTVWPDP